MEMEKSKPDNNGGGRRRRSSDSNSLIFSSEGLTLYLFMNLHNSYNTVKLKSMNILGCSHYTTVYDTDNLKGITPLDWTYGIKLSYSVHDTGCERCVKSGGTRGFDTEIEGMLCLCSRSMNSTRQCAARSFTGGGVSHIATKSFQAFVLVIGAFVYMIFT